VYRLEQALLKTLETLGVSGHRVAGEPGVYVRADAPFDHAVLLRAAPRPTASKGSPRSPRSASR
jgi:lipoyl(octanoyl) transferase